MPPGSRQTAARGLLALPHVVLGDGLDRSEIGRRELSRADSGGFKAPFDEGDGEVMRSLGQLGQPLVLKDGTFCARHCLQVRGIEVRHGVLES